MSLNVASSSEEASKTVARQLCSDQGSPPAGSVPAKTGPLTTREAFEGRTAILETDSLRHPQPRSFGGQKSPPVLTFHPVTVAWWALAMAWWPCGQQAPRAPLASARRGFSL